MNDSFRIAGCDPGSRESALVIIADNKIVFHDKLLNSVIHGHLPELKIDAFCLEGMDKQGGRSGKIKMEYIYEALFWGGRFFTRVDAYEGRNVGCLKYVASRRDIKNHFGAKDDSGIREEMMNRWGSSAAKITRDQWSALAIASYCQDQAPWKNPDLRIAADGYTIVRF